MNAIVRLMAAGLLFFGPAGAAKHPFTLRSPDFRNGAALSARNEFRGDGCTGRNIAPTLIWTSAPKGTRSFALVVLDPDAPKAGGWVHWLAYNVPARWHELSPTSPHRFDQGLTDFGTRGYGGPCPPPNGHTHHYIFTLYALNTAHLAGRGLTCDQLLRAMKNHVIATASLTGTFRRP